jgi:hypothetical protein
VAPRQSAAPTPGSVLPPGAASPTSPPPAPSALPTFPGRG